MKDGSAVQEFHPEIAERRGEWVVWISALLVTGAWLVLSLTGGEAPWMVPALAIFLALAGLGISLANWMDRRTTLRIGPDSVHFTNGLRNTHLPWERIREVQTVPSPWGKKVRVIGEDAYFEFRTLGEVKLQGSVKGRMGFAAGEKILRQIVQRAGLHESKRTSAGVYYYLRE
jgi:hypothetical protein